MKLRFRFFIFGLRELLVGDVFLFSLGRIELPTWFLHVLTLVCVKITGPLFPVIVVTGAVVQAAFCQVRPLLCFLVAQCYLISTSQLNIRKAFCEKKEQLLAHHDRGLRMSLTV